MNKTFAHVHASGRFDSSVKSFKTQLDHFVNDYDASIITGTECEYDEHKEVVQSFPGFASNSQSQTYADDSYIMWKTDEWAYLSGGTHKLTDIRYVNVRGLLRLPGQAKWVVLIHRASNRRLLVTVTHLPSSVESKKGFITTSKRVAAWLDSVKNWRSIRNEIYKNLECDAMIVAADWNVDFKSKFFRSVIHRMQKNMRAVPSGDNMPSEGTLGNRLVDFSLIRGHLVRLTGPYVMKKTAASDHRPYKEVLRFV